MVGEARAAAAEGRGEREEGDEAGSFGAVLRELRSARGVSQSALAVRAGIDRSYVNRLEAGERGAPTEAGTEALARGLDLTDAEAERLFAAAGQLPRSLRAVGPADATILLLAQRLTDPRLSAEARAALRATVETIARCWADPGGAVAGPPEPPGPGAAGAAKAP